MATVLENLNDYVTVMQAARAKNKSEQTMRDLADAGVIRSVRTPAGHRLLLRRDVEALVFGKRGRRRTVRRNGRNASERPAEQFAAKGSGR